MMIREGTGGSACVLFLSSGDRRLEVERSHVIHLFFVIEFDLLICPSSYWEFRDFFTSQILFFLIHMMPHLLAQLHRRVSHTGGGDSEKKQDSSSKRKKGPV